MHKAIVVVGLLAAASVVAAAPAFSNFQAFYRSGQVFLTWDEAEDWNGNADVYISQHPITQENIGDATLLIEGLGPHLADDIFLNPRLYRDEREGENWPEHVPTGFRIAKGAELLKPTQGLFVHTVTADDTGDYYYAVIAKNADGSPNHEIMPGVNSLTAPVAQQVEPIEAIWYWTTPEPRDIVEPGLALELSCHGATGRGGREYVAFGDKTMGWREGLPMRFGLAVRNGAVYITPTNRQFIGRPMTEAKYYANKDRLAIQTWWFGYSDKINVPGGVPEGVATNYAERELLWLIDWAKRAYKTDPNRTYWYGSSMGGSGGVSFALRHPEIFAALRLNVPAVSYNESGVPERSSQASRFQDWCGPIDKVTSDGRVMRERFDGTSFVRNSKENLPLVVVTHGRNDPIMQWWKAPDFYHAFGENRQALIAHWNDGDHGGCGSNTPPDIKRFDNLSTFHNLALNKSYLAFTSCSADQDPGNGDKDNGDIVGFINRGLSWEEPVDTTDSYEILVKADPTVVTLPVTVDITPRRLQQFKFAAGDHITVTNADPTSGMRLQQSVFTVGDDGLLTVTRFSITSPEGNMLRLSRAQ